MKAAVAWEPPRDAPKKSESWPPPIPLPPRTPTVPPLDLAMLPEPLRDVIEDAAERACLPVDYFVAAFLVTLSGAIGNRWRVQPKRRDDFLVVLNLWGALVAHSGMMKSYATKLAIGFLEAIEQELHQAYEAERFKQAGRVEDLELTEASILERRKKAAKDRKVGELANLRTELNTVREALQAERLPEPRLIVNDATVEKLLEILRDNERGILMNRDELVGFFRTLDKQGREGDRPFYLEAWTGDHGFKQDRIGRGTITADIVTLSLYGTIQPGVFREYQEGATDDGIGADGLLQRFQILVWPDENLPPFQLIDREPNHAAQDRLQTIYRRLYDLDPAAYGFAPPEGSVSSVSTNQRAHPGILKFDEAAQRLYDDWIVDLENRLRAPSARTRRAYLSHISKYRSLFPALAGLFHLITIASHENDRHNRQNLRIPLESAITASALVDYLDEHARKVYDIEISSDRHAAANLLNHLTAGHAEDGITIRDLQRKNWKGLDRSQIEMALAYLETRGWLRIETTEPGAAGGRPSRVVRLHPRLTDYWDDGG
ncbi:MAG: DUF3987 domain-containing protein, partial [Trueperaceae bacterium]|nr:DUF3987 domain-containing protein [Trueperaceae bacterium]